jgi:hypothetical protein
MEQDICYITMDFGDNLKLVILGSLIYQIIHQHHDSQYAVRAVVRKTRRWIMH